MDRFNARPIAANATLGLAANTVIHGFLCTTAGSMKLAQNADGSGADIVANVAVTAGTYVRMPCAVGVPAAVVLSGGAAGTLFAL